MLVWIDTDSGTWGVAENNLTIFDASSEEMDWLMEDHSDSEIIDYGLARWTPLV